MFMLVLGKAIFLFLILQQLSARARLRGFVINVPPLQAPWMFAPILALFFVLYPSPDFAYHWIGLLLPVTALTLVLASLRPLPGYDYPFTKLTADNGLEAYHFPGKLSSPTGVRVFFHGAGNDALFDNYELFQLWHEKGYAIWAVNLPGHGAGGSTRLDPEKAWDVVKEGLEQLAVPLNKNTVFVGESLGALFALQALSEYPALQEAHLLCLPVKARFTVGGALWEGLHFFGFQLWWRLGSDTFWEAIPSFSQLKRKAYPVRWGGTENAHKTERYLAFIKSFVQKHHPLHPAGKSSPRVVLFQGILDGVIPWKTLESTGRELESMGFDVQIRYTRAFHLSIKKWYYRDCLAFME